MAAGRLSTLVLAVVLGGCGGEAGVEESLPQLDVTRSISFGDEEGEGALSGVFGVAESADGHLFLSEPQFGRVVEFDPDGTFSRVVGGRGQGPGEFSVPGGLWWRADSLAVSDFSRGIHLFSPEGEFVDLIFFNINDGSSAFGVRPMFLLADGSVAAFAPASSGEIARGSVTHETWLKASRDGAIIDTLAVVGIEGRQFSIRFHGSSRSGTHPLSWAPLVFAPPSGTSLVIADRLAATGMDDARYQVIRVGVNGDTLNTAMVSYDPVPVQAEQVDSMAIAIAEGWAERLDATVSSVASAISDQVEWPAYQPPVTALLCGADGTVWLRRETVGVTSARWDILDEDLSPIAWVNLPMELDLKVVARDHAYGVELDEFDVPTVVRFDVAIRQQRN